MTPDITPGTEEQAQQFAHYLQDHFKNAVERVMLILFCKQYFVVSVIRQIPCNIVIYWVGKHKIDCVGEFASLNDQELDNLINNYCNTQIKPYETYRTNA